jgi:hypothetical protein
MNDPKQTNQQNRTIIESVRFFPAHTGFTWLCIDVNRRLPFLIILIQLAFDAFFIFTHAHWTHTNTHTHEKHFWCVEIVLLKYKWMCSTKVSAGPRRFNDCRRFVILTRRVCVCEGSEKGRSCRDASDIWRRDFLALAQSTHEAFVCVCHTLCVHFSLFFILPPLLEKFSKCSQMWKRWKWYSRII